MSLSGLIPVRDPASRCRDFAEGKDHLPWHAGSAFPHAGCEAVCLLCCKGTLLAQQQLSVLHSRAFSAKSVSHQCALVSEVIPPKGQELAHPFAELHNVPVLHFSSPVRVLQRVAEPSYDLVTPPSFFAICKPVQGALSTIDQSINEESKQYWLWYQPLRHTPSDWVPVGLHAPDRNPLSPEIQPIFNSSRCPLI